MGRLGTTSSGRLKSTSQDLGTLEGLTQYAKTVGLGKEAEEIANPKPKLSILQRLGTGLSALNPAEAILTGKEQGVGTGVKTYFTGALRSIGSAVTGTDYNPNRRMFKEVAEAYGVENGVAKFGLGFLGDVLLDPSTYFGGAIAKGMVKGASLAGGKALTTVGRFAPETEAGLRMAGTGLGDAFGRAFKFGYKSSRGATDDVASFLSKSQQSKLGLAQSNLNRLGTGILNADQQQELALKLIAGKRAELQLGEATSKNAIQTVNKLFPDIQVKSPQHAEQILNNLETTTQKSVEAIRNEVDKIVQPFFKARQTAIKSKKLLEPKLGVQGTPALGSFQKVDELNTVVDKLRVQLANLRKSRAPIGKIGEQSALDLGGAITKEEAVTAHNALIKYEEERLVETIDNISSKIESFRNKTFGVGVKTTTQKLAQASPEETIVYGERMIQKLQNDLAEKSRLLTTATQGRITASSLIKTARETGDFSKIQEIAPDLVEKVKEGSTDPLIQKTLTQQMTRTQKFAGQLGLENPYETYFPFIKKDKLDAFVKQVGASNLRVGSEGYAKQFKNLLTNEAIETNPAKAFFTSEAQQVGNRMTRDFLQGFVKKYGKGLDEFANADEAAKAGFGVIKEKGFLGKEIGYLNKYDTALIRDSISPEFQTINMLAKATGFDAVTSLFKRSVTGLFAPFHVRNYMSGHIQNFEVLGVEALNPKNINIGQKIAYNMAKGKGMPTGTIALGGKTMKFKDLMKPFVDRFSGDTFYNADFDSALKAGAELKQVAGVFSKERLITTAKTLGLGQEAIPFKVGRAVGQFIEHSQKATAYVTALGQGKTIQEALELATRAGFDYRQLTRFESQIMRRIVPFYSFARKNIGLQLTTLGENPERINQILRFFGNIGDSLSEEEKKALPEFIRDSIGIRLEDTPEGLKQYISSFGTPIEAFTQLFGSNPILRTISQMNPILKAPIEIGIGKDSFRQRDLKDVYDANEYKLAPQVIKDLLDITEVDKPILKKNGAGKLVQVGTKKQYVADPVRLLIARSLFTSRGVSYLDQVFGGDMEGFTKLLKTTTGIKPQQIDLEMQKSIQNTNKKREVEDLLTKRGGLNTYSTVYKPK